MKLEIYFLRIEDCEDCQEMLSCIERSITDFGRPCEIISYYCDEDSDGNVKDPDALDLAIEHGLDDLPACVIGEYTFCGKYDYDYDEILEAIEKTWGEQA